MKTNITLGKPVNNSLWSLVRISMTWLMHKSIDVSILWPIDDSITK